MASENCPVCTDSFERETPEKAANSVIAHMCSKNDDDHSGIGYEKASQMVRYQDISDDEISETGSADIDSPESTKTATPGPRDPPEPDVDVATDGGAVVEDVVDELPAAPPDGFEPVGDVCDDLEKQYPEIAELEDWKTQRAKLESKFDFVLVEREGEDGDPSIVDGVSREDL